MKGRLPALALQPQGGHPAHPQAAGVDRGGQGELRGDSRQDNQCLGSLQSQPRGGWCPKELTGVPRGWLMSQGEGLCPKKPAGVSRGWLAGLRTLSRRWRTDQPLP